MVLHCQQQRPNSIKEGDKIRNPVLLTDFETTKKAPIQVKLNWMGTKTPKGNYQAAYQKRVKHTGAFLTFVAFCVLAVNLLK